jgi:membrane protease YdiL (CAAX protease family)
MTHTADTRNQLITFFLLTYVVTWVSWLGAWAISDGGFAQSGLWMLPFYIGVFAPGFVAVWLTFRGEGSAGVRALLSRLVQWEARLRWYVFALTYMAAIKLAAALIHRLATAEWPRFGNEPLYLMLAATLGSMVVFGQSGEEVGWRGYGLPRLAGRMGLARASIVVGIIWATWHLPLFFIPGTGTTGQSFPIYMLSVTAISVAIAWLYQHTNGSLFLTMLMHSAINNTKDIVPSLGPAPTSPFAISASLIGWLTAGLMWVCAAYFLFRMKRKTAPDEGRTRSQIRWRARRVA